MSHVDEIPSSDVDDTKHARGPGKLSHVDAAWLRMDTATNPMVITSLLVFGAPLERAAVDALIARLVESERFRQRVVEPTLGAPRWERDPHFDPKLHVHRIALPSPGGDAALSELVSDLMGAPLDRSRPLWQVHVVERVGNGAALVVRIHHAMGDGVALVALLLSLAAGVTISPEQVGLLAPDRAASTSDLAKRSAAQALALSKLLLLPGDPPTPLKGEQSSRKRVAWSKPIPLETVKGIAKALGATVNDVLTASVTAGMRSYFHTRDVMRDGLEVHAIVPVFLRGTSGPGELGNHFGLIFLALPLGSAQPGDRVRAVKLRMDEIKRSPEASVSFAVLAATGLASLEVEKIVIDIFSKKASLLITNVPGPPIPIELAGSPLESIMVWAPTSGAIGFGVTLLSYAGAVRMGVQCDAALVPDPERVVAAFEADLEALVRAPS